MSIIETVARIVVLLGVAYAGYRILSSDEIESLEELYKLRYYELQNLAEDAGVDADQGEQKLRRDLAYEYGFVSEPESWGGLENKSRRELRVLAETAGIDAGKQNLRRHLAVEYGFVSEPESWEELYEMTYQELQNLSTYTEVNENQRELELRSELAYVYGFIKLNPVNELRDMSYSDLKHLSKQVETKTYQRNQRKEKKTYQMEEDLLEELVYEYVVTEPDSINELREMSYRELQNLSKYVGIKANQKKEELRRELAYEYGFIEPGSVDELHEMSYRELQQLSKCVGIKANQEKEKLRRELAYEYDYINRELESAKQEASKYNYEKAIEITEGAIEQLSNKIEDGPGSDSQVSEIRDRLEESHEFREWLTEEKERYERIQSKVENAEDLADMIEEDVEQGKGPESLEVAKQLREKIDNIPNDVSKYDMEEEVRDVNIRCEEVVAELEAE
jgi:hypothetical protein